MKLTKDEAVRKIMASKGKLFSVVFVKRTTGERRKMVARRGVRKSTTHEVTGTGLSFDPKSRDLIPVCEFKNEDVLRDSKGHFVAAQNTSQFRMVNAETLLSLKIGGQEFEVEHA